MTGVTPGGHRRRAARLAAVLGLAIALVCLWFVFDQLATDWSRSRHLLVNADWMWAALAVPVATVGMASLGFVWRSVLRTLGADVRSLQVMIWYQIGMLGKYVPGGVFAILGRAELAHRGGVPRSIAYNSVALSMGTTYLAGALVSALLLPFTLLDRGALGEMWWVLSILPVGAVVLHPRVLGKLLLVAERLFGGADEEVVPSWGASIQLVLKYMPSWLVNGLACWLTALCFVREAPIASVVFAGIASWVAGFLVVFVPSGAGVREAMFVALTAGVIGGPAAAATAVVSRLVFVSADLISAGVAAIIGALQPADLRGPDRQEG